MSAAIFPFRFLRRGFREFPAYRTDVHEASAGRRVIQRLHAADELVVRGQLLFPLGGKTYPDFVAFWLARSGPWDPFLYKAGNPGAKVTVQPDETDPGQTLFTLVRKYVDVATLVVKKAGAVQTLGVHYFIENESGGAYVLGTSTKCVVRFAVAPDPASVEFTYEFYYPVRFEGDEMPGDQELDGGGYGSAAVADRTVSVALRETGPGFSYVTAPNSL